MSSIPTKPNTKDILNGLKDFQRQTVDYVYGRLYEDEDAVDHFLIADEVGLGKTLVARGIIAKAIEKLWDKEERIDILYICANRDIAKQNINRLNITNKHEFEFASRMTLLPLHLHNLKGNKLNFISFTPETSFNLRSKGGIASERALIYHILREHWKFGNITGPKNLFQCTAGKDSWRLRIDNFHPENIDTEIALAYKESLLKDNNIRERFNNLSKTFSYYRENVPQKENEERLKLIGDLRRILAESCIHALEPDIVILDEFQRFKNLIDGEDDMALLAQVLFEYSKSKTILLSATPYKMYTMHSESDDENHYADFIRTVKFLFNSKEETKLFEKDLQQYRRDLFNINRDKVSGIKDSKEIIETKLRKVMVRTERTMVDNDAMVMTSSNDLGKLTTGDLHSFVLIDNVAKNLGNIGDTVEYWKSAPYLLNFMDNSYKIKRDFSNKINSGKYDDELINILNNSKVHLLSKKDINSYKKVEPNNSKLQLLIENTIENGAWKLLWMPPSHPYYTVRNSPFNDDKVAHLTKSIIFSSWQVVPKVISTLCSYEVERHISSSFGLKSLDQIKPILKFSLSKNRLTGMSNFTLMYPCMTLATKIDPLMPKLMTADKMPYKSQITKEIKKQIKSFIKPITKKYSKLDGQYDQRWYWAALVLLDKHYYSKPLNEWFENTSEENSWKQMLQSKEDANTNSKFASHVDELFKCFQGNLDLGPPPRDLADVLTKIALASPAVVGLRSLMRVCNTDKTGTLLSGAAKMALGFRYLFNLPSSISIIRSLKNKDNSHYWINVLDYCIDGNLQSVIDEYLHILQESLGIINKSDDGAINEITNEVYDAMTIRTVNLKFDDIVVQPRKKVISQNKKDTEMRCRFALRFGDSKNDEDKEKTRSDQVRKAFNSPFSPFILASTSIGQEGLDFHQYCHEIYHWNLPSNPVDLEQREGRINRYKGHAIRKNVAKKYTFAPLNDKTDSLIDPWKYLFSCAVEDRDPKHNDLVPYWVFELEEGGYRINRHIPVLPFSREKQKQDDLRNSLVAYRMVFGQPRQEDLVNYLNSRFDSDLKRDELLKYKIDLSPNV